MSLKTAIMRIIQFIILTGISLFTAACFSSPKEKLEEQRLAELINEKSKLSIPDDIDYEKTQPDYSKIKISEDSIDMVLYKLIESSYQTPTNELIKQVEILMQQGADANASLTIHASVRKTGTYIPIIKHFYKNKYRNYTYISTPFHAAVATGKTALVKKMIELGAEADTPTNKGDYPINMAIENNDQQMVFFLLDNGANSKRIDLSPLKDIDLIEKLVIRGSDPNTIDINFALHNKTELKRVLALNPNMHGLELDFDILFNDDELLNLLLDNGLPLSTTGTSPDGCPLIFGAVKYDNIKALKKLISLGADKSENCSKGFGETPLLLAIYKKNALIVAYLLSIGVSPNEMSWTKESALSKATDTDNDRIINALIDAGANIEYNGYFNNTPLMSAVDNKKYVSVSTLLDREANVNYKNKYDKTPLIIAIKKDDYPIIKLLVENGAKTDIKYDGKTLVEYAKEEEASPMIIDYLNSL